MEYSLNKRRREHLISQPSNQSAKNPVERANVKDVSLHTHRWKRTSPIYRVAVYLTFALLRRMFNALFTSICFSRSMACLSLGMNGSEVHTLESRLSQGSPLLACYILKLFPSQAMEILVIRQLLCPRSGLTGNVSHHSAFWSACNRTRNLVTNRRGHHLCSQKRSLYSCKARQTHIFRFRTTHKPL